MEVVNWHSLWGFLEFKADALSYRRIGDLCGDDLQTEARGQK